jgi:hypothetical protein
MRFSDADGAWQNVPEWVSYLLRFGYDWPRPVPGQRRIGVISLPCDSAAAGLVALGAMRRRLEEVGADDVNAHFARLCALALRSGEPSFLRHLTRKKGRWVFARQDPDGKVFLKNLSRGYLMYAGDACDWQFEGEPPVRVRVGDRIPYESVYSELLDGAGPLHQDNLSRTDSGVCLAGRLLGEQGTQKVLAEITFEADGCRADLSQLLTVHSWTPQTISRASLFNARTGEHDRTAVRPQLVVADGDVSFLKVVDREEFEKSDVIGVTHLMVERDRLEDLAEKLESLRRRHYESSDGAGGVSKPPPRGVAAVTIRRSS